MAFAICFSIGLAVIATDTGDRIYQSQNVGEAKAILERLGARRLPIGTSPAGITIDGTLRPAGYVAYVFSNGYGVRIFTIGKGESLELDIVHGVQIGTFGRGFGGKAEFDPETALQSSIDVSEVPKRWDRTWTWIAWGSLLALTVIVFSAARYHRSRRKPTMTRENAVA